MKRLFTLVALLAMVLGASAKWSEKPIYSIDYSTRTSFPFYVMGYVPEFDNGCMTDFGADYRYETQANLDGDGDGKWKDGESSVGTVMAGSTEYQKVTGAGPYWHQYFIADNITTKIDGKYKVIAKVKATADCQINVNMGWNWSGGVVGATVNIPAGGDFQEVEWQYEGIGGASCNLVAQPGTHQETIEWLSLEVYEWEKEGQRPQVWQQWLTDDGQPILSDGSEHTNKYMGDAETAWPAWSLEQTDGVNINWRTDRAPEICAWALTMGKNNDSGEFNGSALDGRARPYPADIEAEEGNASNHVYAVHVTQIDCIDDCDGNKASTAWSNQFWIQNTQNWKKGDQVRIKFSYKAEHACKTGTQWHRKNPSNYNHWSAAGDVSFTTEWQEFEKTLTVGNTDDAGPDDYYSLAFNLCSDEDNGRTPNVFYFDNLSWETLKLDEGYFVSGINTNTTKDYDDLDNAIQFEDGEDAEGAPCLVAVFGTKGDANTYVNQMMVSTKRGDDQAFKGATLKPVNNPKTSDPLDWIEYAPATTAKIGLPGLGVWKVYLDEEYKSMAFEMLEGTLDEPAEPVDLVTNATEIVINGVERDWRGKDNDGNPIEAEVGEGQTWDNQFFIVANRVLKGDEETVVEFDYVATVAFNCPTGTHAQPGDYRKNAFEDVPFETTEKHFRVDYKIPATTWGGDPITDAQSIAFDMAVVKEANTYTIKNVKWYLKSDEEGKTLENLINETGTDNFFVKIGAGNPIVQYGTDTGITNITSKTNSSSATYNVAGQKVDKNFKGIVVKDGKKFVNK